MERSNLIQIQEICRHCKIDLTFIEALNELGHVELIIDNKVNYIHQEQLKSLERLIYFHNELHINIEGIDAIVHLLNKIEKLQHELSLTKSKLDLFHNE